MTHSPKTPTRAEALEYLKRVKKNPAAEIPLHLTKYIDFLIDDLSATDAPIEKIEGLDEAIETLSIEGEMPQTRELYGDKMVDALIIIDKAAKAYAALQGGK